jgi:hypothetical protein
MVGQTMVSKRNSRILVRQLAENPLVS